MEQYFDIELSFAQSATRCKDEKTNFTDWKMCKRQWIPINKEIKGSLIECEWLIMSGMKNPNINNVEYRETVFPFNNQDNTKFNDFLIGWIGWMGSYNGRFFDGGYSGHSVGKRDYISEQIKNTEAQLDKIKDITFIHSDYSKLEIPNNTKDSR